MSRPLLLILDGPVSHPTGVAEALDHGGWDTATSPSAEAVAFLGRTQASVVLLDPTLSGEAGIRAVQAMRAADLDLPVVVLKQAGAQPEGLAAVPGAAGELDGSLPVKRWAKELSDILTSTQREKHKFTAEDLFADILADIESGRPTAKPPVLAPAATQPFTLTPPPAAKPAVPAPAPRPAAPVPAPAMKLPLPAPKPEVPKLAPKPVAAAQTPLPDLFEGILAPLPAPEPVSPVASAVPPVTAAPAPVPVPPAPPITQHEITLSGISGIQDPFEGAPAAALEEGAIEFLSEDKVSEPEPPAPAQGLAFPTAQLEIDEKAGVLEEFGNYYLLEKIAVGGMAELFKARQRGVHNFEKIVAIKRILPHLSDNDEFVRMFIDEAKLAAQLTHPNIVQIFDLGKAGGFYYIAMEYVDGKDLRSMLRKVRDYKLPFPESVAAFVTMKVAGALDYAHRKKGMNDKELKLVHRDISPQNILISSDGAVKLVDFGIAKAATKTTQTVAGALKGKLLYMSPEQALGQPLDSRSDIYSLGLVLFELLTGERCFQADSELGVLEKVRLGKIQDIRSVNPAVSKEMAAIVERALQKDVEHRYPSARFLERDLKALLAKSGNEPVEHDIAEYGATLLNQSKEHVEVLLAGRFSKPAPRQVAPPVRLPEPEPPTTGDTTAGRRVDLPPPMLAAPPENLGMDQASPTRWLLPVVALVLAAAAIVLWVVFR